MLLKLTVGTFSSWKQRLLSLVRPFRSRKITFWFSQDLSLQASSHLLVAEPHGLVQSYGKLLAAKIVAIYTWFIQIFGLFQKDAKNDFPDGSV